MVSSFGGRRQENSELGARMQRKKGHLRESEEASSRRQKAESDRPATKDLIAGTEHRAILQLGVQH